VSERTHLDVIGGTTGKATVATAIPQQPPPPADTKQDRYAVLVIEDLRRMSGLLEAMLTAQNYEYAQRAYETYLTQHPERMAPPWGELSQGDRDYFARTESVVERYVTASACRKVRA
jgi:hypothetical protein